MFVSLSLGQGRHVWFHFPWEGLGFAGVRRAGLRGRGGGKGGVQEGLLRDDARVLGGRLRLLLCDRCGLALVFVPLDFD